MSDINIGLDHASNSQLLRAIGRILSTDVRPISFCLSSLLTPLVLQSRSLENDTNGPLSDDALRAIVKRCLPFLQGSRLNEEVCEYINDL